MNTWTMNTADLKTGMLIRRPGLDEALEVVQVRSGQAKIKLPGGKTSTIPAASEVEFTWPDKEGANPTTTASAKPVKTGKSKSKPEVESEPKREPVHTDDDDNEHPSWQTDWSLLTVGAKIEVLGEPGDFTVLRLTDSNARIKHNTTGQIQPMSIGHKFKVIESNKVENNPATKRESKKTPAESKSQPEPKSQVSDNDPEVPFETDQEILADVENGDTDPDDEEIPTPDDDDDREEDEDEIDNDLEDDPDNDTDLDDNDDDNEEIPMAKSRRNASTSTSTSASASTPASTPTSEWITIHDLSARTGMKPPKINTLRKAGKLSKSQWKTDPTDARRILYHESTIDTLANVKSSGRGRKSAGKATNSADRKQRPSRSEIDFGSAKEERKLHAKGSASSAATNTLTPGAQTIDSMLSTAIDHAHAQIAGLQALIDNLSAQREQLKLWS